MCQALVLSKALVVGIYLCAMNCLCVRLWLCVRVYTVSIALFLHRNPGLAYRWRGGQIYKKKLYFTKARLA
jgi:hypothetical protein